MDKLFVTSRTPPAVTAASSATPCDCITQCWPSCSARPFQHASFEASECAAYAALQIVDIAVHDILCQPGASRTAVVGASAYYCVQV